MSSLLGVVGDVEPRPRRGNTSEGKRQERIALWSPANPGSRATDSAGAKILEAARARVARPGSETARRERAIGRWFSLPRRETR